MKNVYYKSRAGNFGDDLNEWLWPKLFNFVNNESDAYFLGIGSILGYHNVENLDLDKKKKKIVFGTGYRPSLFGPKLYLDKSWDIRFLRGPLSKEALGMKFDYIADSAYALMHTEMYKDLLNTEKKYELSVMPYYKSVEFVDWERLCKKVGVHYISPCSEKGVEFTLKEIASSKRIVTEAMHGAIAADILRVPWKRFVFSSYMVESPRVSEFKWNDWLGSIDIRNNINPVFIPFYTQNTISRVLEMLSKKRVSAIFFNKRNAVDSIFTFLQESISCESYFLSTDRTIDMIAAGIGEQVKKLRSEYQLV